MAAVPILLRRLMEWRAPLQWIDVGYPIRVHRDRFLNRDQEFSRFLQLAGSQCGANGWVLVLLDADDECPATKGPEILARAKQVLPNRRVSVVLANREFESWFIGAGESLNGCRGLDISLDDLRPDPELPRDAKGWLARRKADHSYGETTDQPAFTSRMSLEAAFGRCRSFKKLCDEWDRNTSPPQP